MPSWVVAVIVGAAIIVGFLLTSMGASVFADGSAYLLGIVSSGQVGGIPGRFVVSAIRDAPVVGALVGGETNLRVLAVAQSVGYVLLPVAVWVTALLASARDRVRFVIVALASGLCIGFLGFFSASELFPALALVAFASTSLASPHPWRAPQAIAVAGASTILIAAHEAVAVCALILVLHSGARARARLGSTDVLASVWVACAGVVAIAWALRTWWTTPNGNADAFGGALLGLAPIAAVLAFCAAVLLSLWLLTGGLRHRGVLSLLVASIVAALSGLSVAGAVLLSGPTAGYRARVWCFLAVLLAQAALWAVWWARRTQPATTARGIPSASLAAIVVFVPLIMAIPLGHALTWSRGVSELRAVLSREDGLMSPTDSMTSEGQRILWGWTNPSLSVIVRSRPTGGVMLDEAEVWGLPGRYAPFEPSRIQSLLPPEFTWR